MLRFSLLKVTVHFIWSPVAITARERVRKENKGICSVNKKLDSLSLCGFDHRSICLYSSENSQIIVCISCNTKDVCIYEFKSWWTSDCTQRPSPLCNFTIMK